MHGDGRGIEREYRRWRKPSRKRLAPVGILLGNLAYQLTAPDHIHLRFGLFVLLPLALAAAWMGIAPRWWRTLVGPGGITVRRVVRSRDWAWHDIYALRVEPHPAQRRADAQSLTYLYDNDGRRFLLPHLDDWQLPDLEAELADLHSEAARYRGMDWEPRPAVEARIRERAAHRQAWTRATSGALCVMLVAFLYLLWRIIVGREPDPFLLLLCVPLAAFALFAAFFHWLCSRTPAARA
ncbi:PH domain-containing protein [Streptomyces sp. NPDC050548]|uniref:PH domain-containing protein n=1 Tax=Streptomyces sp. NPDC050548 TaxID=3365629 RepID=UPI0037B54B5F